MRYRFLNQTGLNAFCLDCTHIFNHVDRNGLFRDDLLHAWRHGLFKNANSSKTIYNEPNTNYILFYYLKSKQLKLVRITA